MEMNCQIPTPREYVQTMLDLAGYTKDLYGKTILENSCGEGGILTEIVQRYITDGRNKGYSDEKIKTGLSKDIKAYEIDAQCVQVCKQRLDVLAEKFGLEDIQWNIKKADYLKSNVEKYDYIIGNPPYITYHNLSAKVRTQLKKNFNSCAEGRFDYCYAFIEKSVLSLRTGGVLVYLVPFSIFRNRFAQSLRDELKKDVVSIIDYRSISIFDNVTASTAILHLIKGTEKRVVNYRRMDIDKNIMLSRESLNGKWFFEEKKAAGKRFGDYFTVQNSVATLYNKAFLIRKYEEDDKYIIVDNKRIEKSILRDAASTKSCKKRGTDKIIFPYRNYDGGYLRIPEEEMKQKYPQTMGYMRKYRKELLKRKSSDGVLWYEYGRTQALNEIWGEKLVISMVITRKVVAYTADTNAVPYAGYFIKKKKGSKYNLAFAKRLLEAPEFYEYIKNTGTPTTETSYRVSAKEIENYTFTE